MLYVIYTYIYDVVYMLYLGPLHFFKKKCPKVD